MNSVAFCVTLIAGILSLPGPRRVMLVGKEVVYRHQAKGIPILWWMAWLY